MRIETARLIIRTFEPGDADAWVAMVSDPEVRRYLPSGPAPTRENFDMAIERRHAMERELGHAMWAVETKETGTFVGQCGLQPVERTGPEIELAYHYNQASWNKGYGTEAAVAVLAHGFSASGLERLIALVVPENVGSWRVMEKAGMRYEGLTDDYYEMQGLKKYVAERDWWKPPTT